MLLSSSYLIIFNFLSKDSLLLKDTAEFFLGIFSSSSIFVLNKNILQYHSVSKYIES